MRLREGVLVQWELPEAVLLDSDSGEYFELNPSGSLALRSLLEAGSLDAATAAVTARYRVEATQARADIEALLVQLTDRGLLLP
jgi:hypothetical protein